MDPLAFLSDDEEDAGDGTKSVEEDVVEPTAKRQKSADKGLDFSALQRAGYDVGVSDEAERNAAEQSLRGSFAALEQAAKEHHPDTSVPSPDKASKGSRFAHVEAGCELPPDSVEVYDELHSITVEPMLTFEDAEERLHPQLVQVMRNLGFESPMPIQAHTWPVLTAGRDLIGVAKTGSGKTLAFLLPFFAKLLREGLRPKSNEQDLPVQMQKQAAGPGAYSPEILVLAPSRELAMQIETEARKFTATVGIATLACYGGEGIRKQQLGQLREHPECVVGTVGRINDFIDSEKHWFGVKNVRFLILDEADHMLSEGLNEQIRKITTDVETPRRQTALFSATFADDVSDLATWITRGPVEIRVGMKDPLRANRDVDQKIVIVKDDGDKEGALKTILRKQFAPSVVEPGRVLVFAFDHEECEALAKKMRHSLNGANVETLHGNRKQHEREKAMADFRNGKAPILIATSLAGRGLDIVEVSLVVNFDPPEDGQDYVHRIGRTGRAGRRGTAITLLRKGPDGRAMIYITQVMRRTGLEVPKDLIEALKQRRGRDMSLAAEVLQGLCKFEHLDRKWAKEF